MAFFTFKIVLNSFFIHVKKMYFSCDILKKNQIKFRLRTLRANDEKGDGGKVL